MLKDGQPVIAAATLELAGTFNMSATGDQWKPFTSRQRVVTHRPGFLWDAKVSMLPGLSVRVVDSYIAGRGLLHAALLGLFTVAEVSGGGEIARGEFVTVTDLLHDLDRHRRKSGTKATRKVSR